MEDSLSPVVWVIKLHFLLNIFTVATKGFKNAWLVGLQWFKQFSFISEFGSIPVGEYHVDVCSLRVENFIDLVKFN